MNEGEIHLFNSLLGLHRVRNGGEVDGFLLLLDSLQGRLVCRQLAANCASLINEFQRGCSPLKSLLKQRNKKTKQTENMKHNERKCKPKKKL